jgi:hypothetical protein
MITNKKLLNKTSFIKGMFPVDIDFTPEEADRFIDYIVDQSVLKGNAQIIRMAKPTKIVRTIGTTGKVLWPDAIFDSTKYKQTVVAGKAELVSKKARGCVRVHDDDLEDNIEGDAFVDHLMRMIAADIANDLDEAYYMGLKSPSGTLPLDINGLWDGWRQRMLSSTYMNAVTGGATILNARSSDFSIYTDGYIAEQKASAPYNWEFKFGKMIKAMPSKYKKLAGGLAGLRFFCSDQIEQDYIDSLSARSTILGDQAILGEGPLHYGKVPIVSMPLMSVDMPVIKTTTFGNSTVAADAIAGATAIVVADATNFAANDYIWIHRLATGLEYKSEVVKIASVVGTTLNLATALLWNHTLADAELVQECTIDGTDCFLTHRDNLMIGIQRDIKMETSREAADESTYFFYSLRADLLLGNPAAVVFLKNLKIR